MDFPGDWVVKHLPANAGDTYLNPGSGRVLGEGTGNPLQYSCQQVPMDRGAWWPMVHRMAKELDMKLTKYSTWSMNDSWYISWSCPKWLPQIKKNLSLSHWTQCQVKVKVAQSCLTLCDPMSFTVPGILQARILEWAAYPFSSGSSQPRNQTRVTCIAGGFFTNWDIRVRSTLQNQSVSSAAQSCLTLCDPMDCSMPGFPVYHQLPEPTHYNILTHIYGI